MWANRTVRAEVIEWALETIQRPDVLYLDTETTGLGDRDELVDIAAVDNGGRVLLNTLIKPRRPIPRDATSIHGITDEMVRTAPSWTDVYPRYLDLLERYRHVIVYNADFDQRMIQQTCIAVTLSPPRATWHCAMKRYSTFAGEPDRYGRGYRWFQLGQAASRLGVTLVPDHTALADAQTCREVVRAMAATL
jgi:DNA polymerase III epsilon subunit-like protein